MPRKHEIAVAARADHTQAGREQTAREHLLDLGATGLPAPPWRPAPVPPSAIDLVQFALWRRSGQDPTEAGTDDIHSALTLLLAARAEAHALEAGLLFTARSAGLTWAQIADAMGFNSPQACQQHYNRLTARSTAGS